MIRRTEETKKCTSVRGRIETLSRLHNSNWPTPIWKHSSNTSFDYETEEEARAQQRAVEPLLIERVNE
jgi:hypothetical protein